MHRMYYWSMVMGEDTFETVPDILKEETAAYTYKMDKTFAKKMIPEEYLPTEES